MPEVNRRAVTPLGAALGRLPSGIFILTTRLDSMATGMLSSWVQQAAFEPPMLTAAVAKGRPIEQAILDSGRFTLNQVARGQKALLRHFGRGFPPGAEAFDGIAIAQDLADGGPVLAEALAWLDAEVVKDFEAGDHRLFLARVLDGALLDESAEPMLHVRRHGFHY